MMTSFKEREKQLLDIQDKVLQGGICFDDLTAFQLENAYISFCAGAYLACIVMCQASIESYIRDDEYLDSRTFYDLINGCSYSDEMKAKLHHLRMYRNKWTHIHIGENNDFHIDYADLEQEALNAYRLTLEVFHYYPFI